MASLRERKGRNKPWEVRWRDETGRMRSRSFALKSEAKAFGGRVDAGLEGQSGEGRTAETLYEFGEPWLNTRVDLKASTVYQYQSYLRAQIRQRLDVPMSRITPRMVQEMVADMASEGYARGTIRTVVVVVKFLLREAKVEGRIAEDPLADAKIRLPRETEAERRPRNFLTLEQVGELAALARGRGDGELARWIWFSAMTGLRIAESLGMRWCDLGADCERVFVREETAKYGKTRWVPVEAQVAGELRAVRDARGLRDDATDPVFYPQSPWAGGKAQHTRAARQVREAMAALTTSPEWDGGQVRPHDLRHTCASLLRAQGADLKDIQTWLGHSSVAVTADIYTHLFPERLDELGVLLSRSREQK